MTATSRTQLTIGEVALRLGLSVDRVRRLEAAGELSAVRTAGGHRRFAPADVEAFRKRHTSKRRVNKPPERPRAPQRPPERGPIVDEDHYEEPAEPWEPSARTEAYTPRRSPPDESVREVAERPQPTVSAAEEQNRLMLLRQYGLNLVPRGIPRALESKITDTLLDYVTTERFPPSGSQFEAYNAIQAKVEAILERHREAKKRSDEEEAMEQRVDELIERGMSQASRVTRDWDPEDRDEACSEIEGELTDSVDGDWTERQVDELVDDLLSSWEADD